MDERDPFRRYATRFGRALEAVPDRLRAEPESTASEVAARLNLPAAAALGPATFFPDLATRSADRRIRVCTAAACLAARGPAAAAAVETSAGPGAATVQPVHCLGYCYAAPAALDGVQPCAGPDVDDQVLGRAPRHDPPIPVRCEAPVPVVTAGLLGDAPPWSVWPDVVTAAGPADVRGEVEISGLRGRGGAGFPVSGKWRAALAHPRPRLLVANGDEGDPGSYVDRLLMESDPHRVLEGVALACYAVGAEHAVVFVRSEYPVARARLRDAVAHAYAAGHLGAAVHGTSTRLEVTVAQGAGSYVSGEETALLNSLEGLRGTVRHRAPYPTEHGLDGRPTVVQNVETLAALPWIVQRGGDAYARLGTGDETGTVVTCLSERFAHPGAYEVELGVSLRHVVEVLGGGLRDGARLRSVQVGGPLGGFLGPEDLDVPLSGAALDRLGVAIGHGGIVAFDERLTGEQLAAHLWSFAEEESCGACSPCRVGARRGHQLSRYDGGDSGVLEARGQVLRTMREGSLCAFGRRVPAAMRTLARVYGLAGWPA